jgi:hypothetical protein
MKVLFLDHDGVICLQDEWGGRFARYREGLDSAFDDFNLDAIKVLNEIIEATDCEIVVSSDWRHHCTLEQMQELYRVRGIKKSPISVTEYIPCSAVHLESARIDEISRWISDHAEVTNWCAVDDMDLSKGTSLFNEQPIGLKNFVRTPNSKEGIKQTGKAAAIIQFLNSK